MVVTGRGIVTTSHYLASQADAQILQKGGTAIDAGFAANAVLGVTEPMVSGVGGDLFLLHWDAKSGKLNGPMQAAGFSGTLTAPRVQQFSLRFTFLSLMQVV